MKGYKTSKDYKRLKELLDKGYRIVGFVNGGYLTYISFSAYKYRYAGTFLPADIDDDDFAAVCAYDMIEFIEPEED